MTSTSIYQILSSKSKNTHYLNRYCKFIKHCQQANKLLSQQVYTERHHICPKSLDMFPEYTNGTLFPWNIVVLTAKQHIIAHIMLWKILGKSQSHALVLMLGGFSRNNKRVPTKSQLNFFVKAREDAGKFISELKMGEVWYNDGLSNHVIKSNETPNPLWEKGRIFPPGYVHNRKGVKIYNDGITNFKIRPDQDINPLWEKGFHNKTFKNNKGKTWWTDGINNYQVRSGDTPESHWTKGLTINKNFTWYNDGIKSFKVKKGQFINDSWIKGLLKNKGSTGYKWYNDGINNYQVRSGDTPESHWTKGISEASNKKRYGRFVERVAYNDNIKTFYVNKGSEPPENCQKGICKKQIKYGVNGSTWWNDGINEFKIKSGETPDPSWSKGRSKKTRLSIKNKIIGTLIYTDGINEFKIKSGETPDPSWRRGFSDLHISNMIKNK